MADAAAEPRSTRNPLPEGTLAVGVGLLVNGLTTYGFLSIASRTLGPDPYAPLAVLWVAVFLVGPGFFLPLEQEISRALAERRARGDGGGPLVRRAATLAVALFAALIVVEVATSGLLLEHLFDDQVLLLVGLGLSVGGQAAGHVLRGTCSGQGRFKPYAFVLGADGAMRLVGCLVLAVAGVETAGPFGLVVGLAPIIAVLATLSRERGLLVPGPEAPMAEVSGALAALLAGSILSFTLVNGGPLAVELLASDSEQAEAGLFLNGLIVARVPLFLFQAVQASLLPKLSHLAGSGRLDDFRDALRRLLAATAAIGAIGMIAAFSFGPPVVRLLFDKEFDLGNRTVGLLATACALYILAVALAQGVIALGGHRLVAAAWGSGVAAFVLGVAFASSELFLRVELGLVIGSGVAGLAMLAALVSRYRSGAVPSSGSVIEALHDLNLEP